MRRKIKLHSITAVILATCSAGVCAGVRMDVTHPAPSNPLVATYTDTAWHTEGLLAIAAARASVTPAATLVTHTTIEGINQDERLGSISNKFHTPNSAASTRLPRRQKITLENEYPYPQLRQCESGDSNADTGNSFYGFYQFTLQSWQAVGREGNPIYSSLADQTSAIRDLANQQGWTHSNPACAQQLGLS